jgi:membrane protein
LSQGEGAGSDLADRARRWWRRTVWEEPHRRASPVRAAGWALLRAWSEAIQSFGSDELEMRATALTFRTLLSLVPFVAVAFSLFQAFGGLEAGEAALRRLLVQNLAPGSAAAAMGYVQGFVSRISAGAIGGVGVVFLVLTVISLLSYMESSMNALWGIERGRPFLSRFVVYWAMITVGPVLLALSLSMTSVADSPALLGRLDAVLPGTSELLFRLVPWVFTCTGMTLLYVIVPNTNVRWRAAVGGGLVAGTLWELGKLAFTWASANLFRYNAVYGSFGALPVFLLWLQVGWIVVLLGSKMTFVLQHTRALRDERLQVVVGAAGRQFLAVSCMIEVARAYGTGEPPPTLHELLPGTRAALKAEQEVVGRLVAAGLLHPVAGGGDGDGGGEDEGYVPARDPSLITLEEIVDVFERAGATPADLDTGEPTSALAREILDRSAAAAADVTGAISLAEAVRRVVEPRDDLVRARGEEARALPGAPGPPRG